MQLRLPIKVKEMWHSVIREKGLSGAFGGTAEMQRARAMFRHVKLTEINLYWARIALLAESSFNGLNEKLERSGTTSQNKEDLSSQHFYKHDLVILYLSVPEPQETLGTKFPNPSTIIRCNWSRENNEQCCYITKIWIKQTAHFLQVILEC